MSLITITPLDKPFTKNDLTVTNNVTDKFKNGTYIVSSSSYSSNNNLAYNAFNATTTNYWESGSTKPGSKPTYVQDPYTNSSPASYVGGGVASTTFKTKAGSSVISGEWIQLQIPYKIFIDSYSILPRQDANSDQFPRKFYLLGSNDGNKWEIIDQQVNPKPSDDKKTPTQFSVTTIYSYTYFRFVISEMTKGTTASICQLNLFGNLNLISNNVYLDQGFVYSAGGTVFYNGGENSTLYSEKGTVTSMSKNLYADQSTINSSGPSTIYSDKGTVNATHSNVSSSGAPVSATTSNLQLSNSSVSANGGTIATTGSVSSTGGTVNANGGAITSSQGNFNNATGTINSNGGTITSNTGTIVSNNDNILANASNVYSGTTSTVKVGVPTPSTPPPPPRAQPTIENGNFTFPSIPNNSGKCISDNRTAQPWTFNACIFNKSASARYNMNYPAGNQCASLEGTQYISQQVLFSKGKCKINFSATGRSVETGIYWGRWRPIRYQNGGANEVKVMFNGSVIGTFTPPENSWSNYSYTFNIPDNKSYEIKFQGNTNSDKATAIQNITLSNVEGFTTMSENKKSEYNIADSIKPFSMNDEYGSFSITENFESNVYVPSIVLQKTYGNTQTPEYIDAIKNYQLNPLNDLIKQNGDIHGNINLAHQKLSEKTTVVLHDQYKLLHNKHSDYRGDAPLQNDKKPTLADGLQEDLNTMIIKENNLYILGTITLATLLVGIIVVARN
jgi:hypothetical protein